jgi:hypothetical protein
MAAPVGGKSEWPRCSSHRRAMSELGGTSGCLKALRDHAQRRSAMIGLCAAMAGQPHPGLGNGTTPPISRRDD